MTKKKVILLITGIVLLLVCVGILLAILLQKEDTPDNNLPSDDMTYTVQVKDVNETPFEEVGVYIYEDASMQELVWYDTTDKDGKMQFTEAPSDTYVAVLSDVPQGYLTEEYYPLTGELTEIILSSGLMTEEDMQNMTYDLGDVMMDFVIVDTEGVEYRLSELLQTKKAVVLNFWYIECQPCNMEFPYMQEAYALYGDDIEILALNPVNTDEAAIAAFKEQMGLTFPMAMVDEAWAQLMQITAYPTTVVIDRYGNISLIHKGMINDTATFVKVFEYFTSDDYEPTAIGSIDEIEDIKQGTKDNPALMSGGQEYEVTVAPGETYYFDLIKVTGTIYMTVEGEDFVLTYNGKEYTPTNGVVTVTVTSDGPSTPVPMQLTNTGDEEQTFLVYMNSPKGSYSNPYKMSLGTFDATTKAGDDQGTYYIYTAEKSGTLTVRCLSSSVSQYGFFLYNLNSYAMRNTDEDGQVDEDGYIYTSVQVKQGHQIQFNVAVARDDSNYISAGSFKFEAILVEGDGEEEGKVELPETVYSVLITDENGDPMPGVTVYFKGSLSYTVPVEEDTESEETTPDETTPEEETPAEPEVYTQEIDQYVTTGDDGIASVTGLPGTVSATVRVPDGYKLETTQYTLTEEAPGATVALTQIVYADYAVTVCYPNGDPVENVIVLVGSGVGFTDENGQITFHLAEDDYSARILQLPARYVLEQDSYAFSSSKRMTVYLSYDVGAAATNPIIVEDKITFTTSTLVPGDAEYYEVYDVAGTTLEIQSGDASVIIDGTTYAPDENGLVSVPVGQTEPVAIAIVNNGASNNAFKVNFTGFPEGSVQNPVSLRNIVRFSINVPADAEGGYYATWTPSNGDGTLTLTLRASSATNCDVIVTTGGNTARMSDSEGGNTLTIPIQKDVPVLIQGIADPNTDGTYPAVKIDISGSAAYDAEPTGVTYSVTVTENGEAQSGLLVQFVKDGSVVKTVTTDASGVATAVLEAGAYTVSFADTTIICDTSAAVLTEEAPAVSLQITRAEDPVAEGMTRYSVSVADDQDVSIGNVLVLYTQNGESKGYSMIPEAGGSVTMDLTTGDYELVLYFLGDVEYHYEETTAKVTAAAPEIKIQVAQAPEAAGEEHYYFGTLTAVSTGDTYVTAQTDALSFYSFTPTEQGVYAFSVSDPDAVISYWGQAAYVSGDLSDTLEGYTTKGFSVSVNTNALGRTLVVGITGTEDTILTVVRTGDAVEDVVFDVYEPAVAPTEYSLPSGLTFTDVDLTVATDKYTLVLNENDGYYHIGSADGPIMYIQMTFNNENPDTPVAPRYIHLYAMVGGIDNSGTGFKASFDDSEGNKVYQDYTAAILAYGQCADDLYGVYPLTEDLMYMLQKGGTNMGWWDPENTKGNLLFTVGDDYELDTTINLELGWLFAGCYIDDGSLTALASEEEPAAEEVQTVETLEVEALPPEEDQEENT